MDAARRFVQAFFALSLAITLVKLSGDSGGGDAFFTLLGLVLAGTIAPYMLGLRAMRRWPRWGRAIGIATVIFGAIDVAVRMQAFYFPTDRSGGGMALWLPLSAFLVIPAAAVVTQTISNVLTRESA